MISTESPRTQQQISKGQKVSLTDTNMISTEKLEPKETQEFPGPDPDFSAEDTEISVIFDGFGTNQSGWENAKVAQIRPFSQEGENKTDQGKREPEKEEGSLSKDGFIGYDRIIPSDDEEILSQSYETGNESTNLANFPKEKPQMNTYLDKKRRQNPKNTAHAIMVKARHEINTWKGKTRLRLIHLVDLVNPPRGDTPQGA